MKQLFLRLGFVKGLFTFVVLFAAGPLYAVINGNAANEKRFDAVGALIAGDVKTAGCTATLITPNWIVTADHCIHATSGSEEEGGGNPLLPEEYEFRLGNDSKRPVFKTKIKRWVSGPKVGPETLDIAFGELASAVPVGALKLDVIPAWSQKWDATDLQDTYIHIGYGVGEAFSSAPSAVEGKRQQAQLTATAAQGNALLRLFGSPQNLQKYLEDFHPQSLEAQSLDSILTGAELGSSQYVHAWDARGRTNLSDIQEPASGWQDTCFGDSGGPLLRKIDGRLYVVGVVSAGMDRICSSLGTRFTIFGPKVQSLMKQLGI